MNAFKSIYTFTKFLKRIKCTLIFPSTVVSDCEAATGFIHKCHLNDCLLCIKMRIRLSKNLLDVWLRLMGSSHGWTYHFHRFALYTWKCPAVLVLFFQNFVIAYNSVKWRRKLTAEEHFAPQFIKFETANYFLSYLTGEQSDLIITTNGSLLVSPKCHLHPNNKAGYFSSSFLNPSSSSRRLSLNVVSLRCCTVVITATQIVTVLLQGVGSVTGVLAKQFYQTFFHSPRAILLSWILILKI